MFRKPVKRFQYFNTSLFPFLKQINIISRPLLQIKARETDLEKKLYLFQINRHIGDVG